MAIEKTDINKTDIKQDSIISNFIQALDLEVISQRKRSSEESISLENGEKTTSTSDKTIYTFFIEEDLKATRLKDDTPVTLIVNEEETYATIVSIGDKKIVVSTDKDCIPYEFVPIKPIDSLSPLSHFQSTYAFLTNTYNLLCRGLFASSLILKNMKKKSVYFWDNVIHPLPSLRNI